MEIPVFMKSFHLSNTDTLTWDSTTPLVSYSMVPWEVCREMKYIDLSSQLS